MNQRGHRLAVSTHTVEMAQIADLNRRLGQVAGPTAAELGLAEVRVGRGSSGPLAGSAVITSVHWAGAPAFPNIRGVFGGSSGPAGRLPADLHTAALRVLSHRLGFRHTWGLNPSRLGRAPARHTPGDG